MIEFTVFFEDFEAEAVHNAYEMTCEYLLELGEDIENFDFNRFVLYSIIDEGLRNGKALMKLLPDVPSKDDLVCK